MQTPSFFPILSLLPQRALVYIKATYPDLYVQTFLDIFSAMWEENLDVSKPDLLAAALSKRFENGQVREILAKATAPDNKQALNANTKEALEQGAFGCPWFWVRNARGEEEPFFGSDRYVCLFPVEISRIPSMVPGRGSGHMRTMKRAFGRARLMLDRFHFMWRHLELPWKDVELLPHPQAKI
jgi:glutathione S-transferase kappa 1